jgi:DNA repair exonuclease SbcCD nuclease subunit
MKILHTSDLQLDAPFLFLGEGGQRHRQQLLRTFVEIVEIAIRDDYQLLLITGDLFNSSHPQQATLDLVRSLLRKLSIPVCLLPGNHDPYDETSLYRRVSFPSNVVVFTDEVRMKEFPSLQCAIYGNPVMGSGHDEKPLEGIRPRSHTRWHVAMAHGNVVTGLVDNPTRPIQLEEIEQCGMDYVALGDWHSFSDHSQGAVRAVYSGAPEPTAYDQAGAGFIASVTMTDAGCSVEKVRIGKVQAQQVYIDITNRSETEILDLIMEHVGKDKMLEVLLSGLTEVGTVVVPDQWASILSEHFYSLRIRDQSHPTLSEILIEEDDSEEVVNEFIAVMRPKIEGASEDAIAERTLRALQLGVALLQGKDVL